MVNQNRVGLKVRTKPLDEIGEIRMGEGEADGKFEFSSQRDELNFVLSKGGDEEIEGGEGAVLREAFNQKKHLHL